MARKHQLAKTVQAKVDHPTFKKIVAVAAAQDISVSCLVRRLIEGVVADQQQQRKAA